MTAAAGTNSGLPPPFPWDAVMHAGLCRLRLAAGDFWAMTPREMQAALGGLRPVVPGPDRTGLQALMDAFPDETADL